MEKIWGKKYGKKYGKKSCTSSSPMVSHYNMQLNSSTTESEYPTTSTWRLGCIRQSWQLIQCAATGSGAASGVRFDALENLEAAVAGLSGLS